MTVPPLSILGPVVAIVVFASGLAWHKHVVDQRDAAQAQVLVLTASRNAFKDALTTSEARRSTEFQQAKDALTAAGTSCDLRVAEARRSAQSINTIVEKPRVQTLDANHCPVPVLVPAGELRDALQPGRP